MKLETRHSVWTISLLALYSVTHAVHVDAADPVSIASGGLAMEIRHLSFGRTGRINWIGVRVGDAVHTNQRLATLNCTDAKADLEASEAELELQRLKGTRGSRSADPNDLEIAKNRVELAELDLAMAQATRQRFALLLQRDGGVSQRDIETADRGVSATKLGVTLARKNLEDIGRPLADDERRQQMAEEKVLAAKVTRARYQISLCEITSPIEGTVVATHRAVGEGVENLHDVIDVGEAATGAAQR